MHLFQIAIDMLKTRPDDEDEFRQEMSADSKISGPALPREEAKPSPDRGPFPPQMLSAGDLHACDVVVRCKDWPMYNSSDWLWVDAVAGVGCRYVRGAHGIEGPPHTEIIVADFEIMWKDEAKRRDFLKTLPIFNMPPEPYNPIREWADKIKGWFR